MISKITDWYKTRKIPKDAVNYYGDWFIPSNRRMQYHSNGNKQLYPYTYQKIEFQWFQWRTVPYYLGKNSPITPN